MAVALAPEFMTADERLDEVAAILAAGFLRVRCRRGYIPSPPRATPEPPPVALHSGPEGAAGIDRN
jgi:hypothetical protein